MRRSIALSSSLLEDQEIVLLVCLGEVVAGDLAETGMFNLSTNDGLVQTMIRTVAILINNAEACPWFKGGVQIGQQKRGMRDFVVDLQHQGGVERVGRKPGIVRRSEDGFDITKVLGMRALLNGSNRCGINFFSYHTPVGSHAAGSTHAEPTAPGPDVCNHAARL